MALEYKLKSSGSISTAYARALLYTATLSIGCLLSGFSYAAQLTKSNKATTYASLFPVNQAALSSRMAGVIQKIYFHPGDTFKKGNRLVRFDCQDINLQAQRSKAELDSAREIFKSSKVLKSLKSVSNLDYAKARNQQKIAEAEYNLMRFQQRKCVLTAPYDGEVVSQVAHENETVKTDDPLLTIVDNRKLEVKMYIPSTWLKSVKVGTQFSLKLDELPEKSLNAQVVKVVGQIDPASQSVLIYGLLLPKTLKLLATRKERLFSGMSGVADFSKTVTY